MGMYIDIDKIINECKQGKYENIAKSGHTECYNINEEFVLVPHRDIELAKTLKSFFEKLTDEEKKNIYTVVDYKVVDNQLYELQRKAKGEHFRIDETKQRTIETIENATKRIEKCLAKGKQDVADREEKRISEAKKYMNSEKYKGLLDSRADELLRRYSMIMKMPKEHIKDFFKTILIMRDNKIEYDSSGNNLLYDCENGFAFIDLSDRSKLMPHLKGNIENILSASDYTTMKQLLGLDMIKSSSPDYHINDKDKEKVIPAMKEALKKIVISIKDLEHNGQKFTDDIIQKNLNSYIEYGITLTIEEIKDEELNSQLFDFYEKNNIRQEELNKAKDLLKNDKVINELKNNKDKKESR